MNLRPSLFIPLRNLLGRLVLILCFALTACSSRTPGSSQPVHHTYFIHTVKYPGETVSIIALWYVGSAQASSEILNHNPKLRGKALRAGVKVKVPSLLMRRSAPMPAGFVTEVVTVKPRRQKPGGPLPNALSTPAPTPASASTRSEAVIITDSPDVAARRRQVLQELLQE